jgi:hypothetical protein
VTGSSFFVLLIKVYIFAAPSSGISEVLGFNCLKIKYLLI